MHKDDLIVESVVERDIAAVLIPDIIIDILRDKPEVLGFYNQLKKLSEKGELNIIYEKALYEKMGLSHVTFRKHRNVLVDRTLLRIESIGDRKKRYRLLTAPTIPDTNKIDKGSMLWDELIKDSFINEELSKDSFINENGKVDDLPPELIAIIRKTFNVDEQTLDKGTFLKLIYIYCSTTITTVLHTLYTIHSTQNTIHSDYIGLFQDIKVEKEIEKPKVKNGRPKKPSFPQAWYNLVLNAYVKNKGVTLSKNEFMIPMKAAKTMFEAGRKPKEIIAFMEWIKAHENEEEYRWLKMWTMYTVAKKLPEFLAGKFENRKEKQEYELINAE